LLRKAYRLREKLTRIFDNEKHTVESGRRAIRRWMAEVRPQRADLLRQILVHPGGAHGVDHELLHQPFLKRLG
jgi:hypothetical protein